MEEEFEEVLREFDDEMEDWKNFHQKYKHQLEKITEYEQKIERLEKRLEGPSKGYREKTENEKKQVTTVTALYLIAALIFIRIISKSNDPWFFFTGGLLIGLGTAGLLKMWLD